MIRVAYIVNSFAMGGLERCVARLVNGLDPQVFETTVICLSETGAAEHWIERPDVSIVELHKSGRNGLGMIRRLAHELRNRRIDIAHSHNWATLIETSVARKWAKTPVHVHAQRGMFFHGKEDGRVKNTIRRAATRWATNRADCLVVVADAVRDYWLKEFGRGRVPIELITNGVDVPDYDHNCETAKRLRAELNIGPRDFVIGSVGRLVPVKSFETLVEAASRLRSRGHNHVHVVLVGDGPERGTLSQLAQSTQIGDRFHLVGEADNVGDWLKTMQLYVNCSLSEGMSQSILEAMAMGLPMVVTDAGANRVLVNGSDGCGDVVPCGNAEAFADAIERYVLSPELCRTRSAGALARHTAHYAVGRMLDEYAQLYRKLMERSGTAHRPAFVTGSVSNVGHN